MGEGVPTPLSDTGSACASNGASVGEAFLRLSEKQVEGGIPTPYIKRDEAPPPDQSEVPLATPPWGHVYQHPLPPLGGDGWGDSS